MSALRCLLAFAIASSSCADPGHEDAVDALGPERRGVRPGPNHRPGQPCLTCHGGDGPGSPEFAVAGTVYLAKGFLEPVAGASIFLRDAHGDERKATSNEVGNFYIGKTTWSPEFPLTVEIVDPRADRGRVRMATRIGRDGSCAACHLGETGDPMHMPAIYLREKPP